MEVTMLVGLVAGVLTMIALLPQRIQPWKTRATKGISLGMFVTFASASSCGWSRD